MRDGVAVAVLLGAVLAGGAYLGTATMDLPTDAAPNATFAVGELDGETVVVEHAGGEPLEPGSVRLLVYEDRRWLPDRTVHASNWEGRVGPGDRRRLEDRRFEPGQRLVVRWFGEDGQANLEEARI